MTKPTEAEIKGFLDRLSTVPVEKVDWETNPPTTAADWENAEELIPIDEETYKEFQAFLAAKGKTLPGFRRS